MKSPVKLVVRSLFLALVMFGNCLNGYAEPVAVQEVTAEATYLMDDNDTAAKAEAQALLRAKKAALEQVSPAAVTMEDAANLANDIFKVVVLDKRTGLNGDKIEYWVQVRAVVQPDKVRDSLKEMRADDEFSYENTLYIKGEGDKLKSKIWRSKNVSREDRPYFGMNLTVISKTDDHVVLALCNNKYYEEPVTDQAASTGELPVNVEMKSLGNETLWGVTTQKRLRTQTYADGKVLTETQWYDPATNWVIKRETKLSTENKIAVRECRNVNVGPQSASLFEIPVGYTKCAALADLFAVGNVSTNTTTNNSTDPLQKATDAALEAATQRVLDNAIGGLFSF